MEEVASFAELVPVQSDNKLQMNHASGDQALDFLLIHLRVVHTPVPHAEGGARWGAYHPGRIALFHQPQGLSSVRLEIEIPWHAIGFERPHIQGIQSCDIEVSALALSLIHI